MYELKLDITEKCLKKFKNNFIVLVNQQIKNSMAFFFTLTFNELLKIFLEKTTRISIVDIAYIFIKKIVLKP